ncbi:pre-rRNA-processing protein [Phanerochaete sordida]|uniref:18S rRNA factor 2 n=1 Tax=Phanerochaete sordida TaxID=48140 RepID=A0A9P3FYF1_9APHY|nr:pre-rRNA-processing protein [Phanerochaete sordida]
MSDPRFVLDDRFAGESEAESSKSQGSRQQRDGEDDFQPGGEVEHHEEDEKHEEDHSEELGEGMYAEGFAGPAEKVVKPLTPEDLAKFKAAQDRMGVVYISRIPPGMRPTKVRHLMSQYGEVGRVYLQPEDPKRTYLRRKFTSTKKVHFTEGWVEFKDKKVARSVAEMLNAQPIGGKKGTRWRDDVWTMKYLPKFKWSMLTEQIAHEAAIHAARLRVELSQSRREQQEYLKNVELARVLDKRAERNKGKAPNGLAEPTQDSAKPAKRERADGERPLQKRRKEKQEDVVDESTQKQLNSVLGSIF